MHQFFLICATIGGTILVLRLVLSLLGFGFEHADVDFGALGHAHLDLGHDLSHGGGLDHADGSVGGHSHLANLGRIFTFQAIVSFLAFFGIGGLSAEEAGQGPAIAVLVATATGLATVFLMGYFLRSLHWLQNDGTVRIERSVGLSATVYLRIPAHGGGMGKVTLPIQGRTIEVQARTPGPELRQGEPVVVTRVLDDGTIEVATPEAAIAKPVSLTD